MVSTQNESLTTRTVRGVWWVGAGRAARTASQLVVNAVLANLLAPGNFGVLGMALVFTGFLDLFNDFGFGKALIQKQDVDQQVIESCLWINVGIGIGLAVLTAVLAPLAGRFYRNDQVPAVMATLALNFPIVALSIVQSSILERSLAFRALTLVEFTASLVATCASIASALLGGGVWSLVVLRIVDSLVKTILIWIISPFRPVFTFSWSSVKAIVPFSANLLGHNAINYLARNADNFLIGRFLDATALGLYTMAYNIMLFPLSNLARVIVRVLFPSLARRQSNMDAFRSGYLRAVETIAFISFPLMMGMYAVAPDFIPLVLGKAWIPIVPIVRILVWVGMVQSILALNGSVFFALGRADLQFKLTVFSSIVWISGIAVGLSFGSIFSVALGYALASALVVVPAIYIPLRLMRQPIGRFLRTLMPISVAGVGMMLGVLTSHSLLRALNPYLGLAGQIVLGVLLYIVLILVIGKSTLARVRSLFLGGFRKFSFSTGGKL